MKIRVHSWFNSSLPLARWCAGLARSRRAVWEFSAPVTLVGTDAPELEIDGEGLGFTGPDSVTQVGPSSNRGDYSSSSGIEIGNAWRVLVAPSHMTPVLAVPQNGSVE